MDPTQYYLVKVLYLEEHDKLWGLFLTEQHSTWYSKYWCWWAVRSKGISVKKHNAIRTPMTELENKKIANGYKPISEDQLLELWPAFLDCLNKKMIFEVLKTHD